MGSRGERERGRMRSRVPSVSGGRVAGGGGALVVVAVVVLILFAFLPRGVTGWVTAFHGPLQTVVGPVSGPLSAASSALRPARRAGGMGVTGVEELARQRDRLRLKLDQANARIVELERRLASVEGWSGVGVGPRERVRARWARVIGRGQGAGTVTVRGGESAGVPVGAVVVDARSRQLVGRVVSNGPTASTVRLITAAGSGSGRWLGCVVGPSDEPIADAAAAARLPRVDLEAVGGGLLRSAPAGADPLLSPGGLVKLDDGSWPRWAQRLVVGRVRRVLEAEAPLMRVVEVVPTVDDLGALSEVVVLVPSEGDGEDGGGG